MMGLRTIGSRFVGKADKLRQVHRVLFEGGGASAPIAAKIVGGAGSGKTRLAAEYLNRYGNYYPGGVFWIDAAAPSLDEELWRVLSDLEPGVQDLVKLRENKVDLKRRLGRALRAIGKAALYVVDDVPETGPNEAARGLAEFCPAIGAVTVLATSRQDSHETGVRLIEVEGLGRNSAVLLLIDRVPGATRLKWADWEMLSSWVGDLPLALDILNAGLAQGAVTGQELLEEARHSNGSATVLDELEESLRPQVPAGALRGVSRAFQVSFDKLSKDGQNLAFVLAHLAPAPIPMNFVLSLPEPLRSGAARAALRSRHFVTNGNDVVFGIMPRLVSDVLRVLWGQGLLGEDAGELLQAVGRKLGGDMQPERFGQPKQWALMNLYRAHAAFLFDRIVTLPSFNPELLRLGALAAHVAFEQGEFAAAKQTQESVLEVSRRLLGEKHPETLTAMNNLAATLAALGQRDKARRLQERVLELTPCVPDQEDPEALTNINNLAETLREQGEFAEARRLQERVLAANLRIGRDRPETLAAMNNLALTLQSQGDSKRAISLQEDVEIISERVFGPEAPSTIRARNNLAASRRETGDLAGARKLGDDVVAIARIALGDEHPDTLRAMHGLAATMMAQGNLANARELQEFVWKTRTRILGAEHPATLDAMNNLAAIKGSLGDLAGERVLEEQIVEIRTRVLGEEHPDTLTSMNNLGVTFKALGDLPKAKTLLMRVLDVTRDVMGNQHPRTLAAMIELANVFAAEGDVASARFLEERVVDLSMRVLGQEHPETLLAMSNLAESLRYQGDLAGARKLQEIVLPARIRVLGVEHPETLTSMGNLGATLIQMGQTQTGLDMIHKVYEGRRKILGEDHPETIAAARILHSFGAG